MSHPTSRSGPVRWAGVVALGLLLPACGTGGGGTLTPTVAPQVPTAFSGVGGPRRATLAWAASPGATTYTVRRSTFRGGPYVDLPGATGTSSLSYVDSGLRDGTPYYYVLHAGNSFGTSADSAPVMIVPGLKADQVDGGESFSVALLRDGSIWAWGDNTFGQLGLPTSQPVSTVAVEVIVPASITSISCGTFHVLALDKEGRVWAWGDNTSGQLGNSSGTSSSTPVRVEGLSRVTQISAGTGFSLALRDDGTVWAWGDDSYGQLGDGGGWYSATPQAVWNLDDVASVSAGEMYSLAVRHDGSVWAWGDNSAQLLGTGGVDPPLGLAVPVANLRNVVAVSAGKPGAVAGTAHSMALDAAGKVWTWGGNDFGQLGNGTTDSSSFRTLVDALPPVVAIAASSLHSLALAADGTVWGWGANFLGQAGLGPSHVSDALSPARAVGLSQVRSIAAGPGHSLAVGADGTIWGFGENLLGELGNGGGYYQVSPVPVPDLDSVAILCTKIFHSYAVRTDGSLCAWGDYGSGEAGTGTGTGVPLTPVRVLLPSKAVTVAAGLLQGYAALNDGSVWSWGTDQVGELGQGVLASGVYPPGPISGLPAVSALAGGQQHGLALGASDGRVWAWGGNDSGQLGSGVPGSSPTPIPVVREGAVPLDGVVAIAAGDFHSLALRSDGTVWGWGDNSSGQLGVDPASGSLPQAAQVPGLSGIVAIAGGSYFNLALKNDGTVWAWGANDSGQLGIDLATPFSANPAPIAGLSGIGSISAGQNTGLAAGADGRVWAWGNNYAWQLGSQATFGDPALVQVVGLPPATAVAAGSLHSLVLGSDGRVYGWGDNSDGELGLSPTNSVFVPLPITH